MFRQYFTNDKPGALLQKAGVLAVISFDARCTVPEDLGNVPIGLNSLSELGAEAIVYGNSMARRGQMHDCHWSLIDELACVATWISPQQCEDIESGTYSAYRRLYATVAALECSAAFRVWNFIPNINTGGGDAEEYKKFCVGRANAFSDLGISAQQFPAASALGHHSEGAVIYLLASRHPGAHFENPMQQSAYFYPRDYGPKSPSFARATKIGLGEQNAIFISGTASIRGNETKAVGDLQRQISITAENVDSLLEQIDKPVDPLRAVRVYLRRAEDYVQAKHLIQARFPHSDTNYLLADICRANLLVELEAASMRPI